MDEGGRALQRLAALRDAHASGGSRTQRPIPWPRERWLAWLPEHKGILEGLPSSLDRAAVRARAEAPRTSGEAVAGFLASMVWGFGRSGYGPWRVRQALDGAPDLAFVLLDAAMAGETDAVAAYGMLAARRS